jgi:hypothetical protein
MDPHRFQARVQVCGYHCAVGGEHSIHLLFPVPCHRHTIETDHWPVSPFLKNIFTNHLTPHFILFIALAVLHSHRDVIIRYLAEVRFSLLIHLPFLPRPSHHFSSLHLPILTAVIPHSLPSLSLRSFPQFDEVLKYANDLSGCIDLSSTLAQAEVLYKSFHALVEDVDRRQAERNAAREAGLRNRGRRVGEASSTAGAASPTGGRRSSGVRAELDGLDVPNLPLISDDLRSLLG